MQESLKKAQAVYTQKCKIVNIRFNKETEPELIEWLSRGKATTRIKRLIREDIKNNPVK